MKIFIGWDSREDIAYQVAKFSIEERTSDDIEIIPLKQHELRQKDIYTRDIDMLGSTEFTFTRFLVPYLSDYKGWSLFIDCDFLCFSDIGELFKLANDDYAVMCVKHDYIPTDTLKMDNCIQHLYPRKNWSSCILFNNSHPSNSILTPELVNTETGKFLHRFQWLQDSEIGSLPHTWNWLEDWYHEPEDGKPNFVHYTRGNVYFKNYQNVDYADEWKNEFKRMSGRPWTNNDILDK